MCLCLHMHGYMFPHLDITASFTYLNTFTHEDVLCSFHSHVPNCKLQKLTFRSWDKRKQDPSLLWSI